MNTPILDSLLAFNEGNPNKQPCHKCLIEGGWSEKVVKCLLPAAHMWKPVEGAEVPLCEMHASRLSKLPSIAATIKPLSE